MHLRQFIHRRSLAGLAGLIAGLMTLQFSPALAPVTVALGPCATARVATVNDGEEQTMLGLINSYRSRSGLSPLSISTSLTHAALWKSGDMAVNRYFSHDDLIRGWTQRIGDCGYPGSAGENIAEGNADASSTFEQWRISPGHNANMLSGNYHSIGVGRAQSALGDWYWTADFGISADATTVSITPVLSAAGQPNSSSTLTFAAGGQTLVPPSLPGASTANAVASGMTAIVGTPGDCLRSHIAPSEAAATQGCLPDGTAVVIVAGPVPADGHLWFQAFALGWLAGDYLRPAR
ncbi:MAG: CAP domain-containing protein [Dehalococcoidia bacterium]